MKHTGILVLLALLFSGLAVTAPGSSASAQTKHPHPKKKDSLRVVSQQIVTNDGKPVALPKVGLIALPAGLIGQDSADDRPSLTLDGRKMYFGSRRPSNDRWRTPDPNPNWKWDSDLWYRVLGDSEGVPLEGGRWSGPINVGPPINNGGGQLNPTVSPNGDVLYYVTGGLPVLWKATLIDGKFQKPQPVGGMLNQIYNVRQGAAAHFNDSIRQLSLKEIEPDSDLRLRAPDAYELHFRERMVAHYGTQMAVDFATTIRCESTIRPDGKSAVISENFGKRNSYGMDGEGGEDLWLVDITPSGGWDTVRRIIGNVNSPYDETYPFFAADGVTLYFTSNRPCPTCPPGTGGRQDIYRTQWLGDHWSSAVPLGPPFNTGFDDYGFSIGPDGKTAYFVSNRSGKSRVYQVALSAADSSIAPKPVEILQGRITDAKTHKPLKAEIFVDDLSAKKNKFSVFSDSISGEYVLAAQRGQRFGLQAVAANHLPHSERFSMPVDQPFDRKVLDFELMPTEVGASLEFKNVYFDFGKSDLLDESKLEIDRVATFLSKSTKTTLEIAGHTDDVGTPEANQKLSEERAQAVVTYLVSRGVTAGRLKAVGYGKTKPLSKARTEEARARNRRVEMIVTSQSD